MGSLESFTERLPSLSNFPPFTPVEDEPSILTPIPVMAPITEVRSEKPQDVDHEGLRNSIKTVEASIGSHISILYLNHASRRIG
jgi:hypothetical protein